MADVPHWLVISHLPSNFLAMVRDAAWRAVSISSLVLLALSGIAAAWLALVLTGRKKTAIEVARAQAEAEVAKHLLEAQERYNVAVKANVNGVLVVDMEGRSSWPTRR